MTYVTAAGTRHVRRGLRISHEREKREGGAQEMSLAGLGRYPLPVLDIQSPPDTGMRRGLLGSLMVERGFSYGEVWVPPSPSRSTASSSDCSRLLISLGARRPCPLRTCRHMTNMDGSEKLNRERLLRSLRRSIGGAESWRIRARELRAVAVTVPDGGASRGLLSAAETYERVAERLDGHQSNRPKPRRS